MLGSLFGLAFGLFFAYRATSSGAGLIWGLGAAFLLWLVLPAGILPLLAGSGRSMAKLADAREQFPELVAYLICLGMPVGVTLGVRGGLRGRLKNPPFHWWRAIIVGGFAGVLGGMIFGRWSSAGDFFPLIAGLGELHSRIATVGLQFGVATIIGSSFGLLFQRDVRGYGSSMGWGLGFGIFWWFLGPLTLFPLVSRTPLDWSADHGGEAIRFTGGTYPLRIDSGHCVRRDRSLLGKVVHRIRSAESGTRRSWPSRIAFTQLGSARWSGGRTRFEPGDDRDRCIAQDRRPRHTTVYFSRAGSSSLGERTDRHDIRFAVSTRILEHRAWRDVGMVVRSDLVVSRADDVPAAAAERRD